MSKIVVVEDDTLLSKMYVQLLHFGGHEVVVVDNGEDAIKVIKQEMPALVLMDVMMPKMNGLQALDALKQDPATTAIPIIVMSNLVNVNSAEEVLARGATQYIDKAEYDARKIVELVNEILGKRQQPRV